MRTPVVSIASVLTLSSLAVCNLGCIRDYDTPEYAEVDTAETAFLVPLEGETAGQAKFQSEKYLEDRKVAAKRVQILHRFNQTGRFSNDGKWIAMVRLIKVNRSPITREWTAEANKGTSHTDQAIWVESADSVGFSMGFTATGYIKEEDAAKFLYWYPSGSLASVMDSEVRARVQQAVAEIAAKYPLDGLRARKQEMTDAARKDVTAFFTQRGITITTVSSFGGMTYENPEIQKAIDNVFIAQQDKSVNLAKFEAQQKVNERLELEATALAEKSRLQARGEADAKVIAAEGESKSILARAQAIREAGPALFQLKQLEIEDDRVKRWDGRYPMYLFEAASGGTLPSFHLALPATTPTAPAPTAPLPTAPLPTPSQGTPGNDAAGKSAKN